MITTMPCERNWHCIANGNIFEMQRMHFFYHWNAHNIAFDESVIGQHFISKIICDLKLSLSTHSPCFGKNSLWISTRGMKKWNIGEKTLFKRFYRLNYLDLAEDGRWYCFLPHFQLKFEAPFFYIFILQFVHYSEIVILFVLRWNEFCTKKDCIFLYIFIINLSIRFQFKLQHVHSICIFDGARNSEECIWASDTFI